MMKEDRSLFLLSRENTKYNAKTGHLRNCRWRPKPNRPGEDDVKPICEYYESGKCKSGSHVSKQSCLIVDEDGRLIGLCAGKSRYAHWYKRCEETKKWWYHLSSCLNKRCDELGFSLEDRKKINPDNVVELTGFPAEYNHISDSLHRWHNLNNGVEISSSDDSSSDDEEEISSDDSSADENGNLRGFIDYEEEQSNYENSESEFEEQIEESVEESTQGSGNGFPQEMTIDNGIYSSDQYEEEQNPSIKRKRKIIIIEDDEGEKLNENKKQKLNGERKSKFCSECGTRRDNMDCKFCDECGERYSN